uniref:Putative secreted protein n=1 Tax=Anopheles triannulatus TaxID=58253 RepID=A0A2M4B2Y5_9DIPT
MGEVFVFLLHLFTLVAGGMISDKVVFDGRERGANGDNGERTRSQTEPRTRNSHYDNPFLARPKIGHDAAAIVAGFSRAARE